MARGCSNMTRFTCLLMGIMLLTTQFAIHAHAGDEGQVPHVVDEEEVPSVGTDSSLPKVQRSSFPQDFVFGTASSAYQYEGAVMEGGRGSSIWDTYSHTQERLIAAEKCYGVSCSSECLQIGNFASDPTGKVLDNTYGDTAVDQYHRFEKDIWLMKDLGMDAYRMSIAWPRILPNGTGEVNPEGVEHYNELINALLENGIQPYVTLFHWDLPQKLEDSFGGWLSPKTIDAYAEFARLSFQLYGDRVKHWITFNEIYQFAQQGYYSGTLAPGRCSSPYGNCPTGDSLREPYIAAHNCLNAHAEAVRIYRTEFQEHQQGVIGITVDSLWFEPLGDNSVDRAASNRAMEFELGWILDPIVFGEYPASMRRSVGERLPRFTVEERDRIRGSYDFIGFNHYTSMYATVDESSASNDNNVTSTSKRNGDLIGVQGGSNWLHVVPFGMRKSLEWIRNRYGNPLVYITENGVDEPNREATQSFIEQLNDKIRITYYHDYLEQLLIAISEGSKVQGYFAWSFLDNWEWSSGFTVRFGIYHVDYKNNLARYPKESAFWFQNMLSK